MTRDYPSAVAFRQALETRLRDLAKQRGVQIQGLRLKVAIERLLARLFQDDNPPWLLKGGYAMELRFRPHARTTRDVDLAIGDVVHCGAVAERLVQLHESLDIAAKRDLGDFFEYVIPPARSALQVAPGGGGVFSVLAMLAGREFARFHIDVGFGDRLIGQAEILAGEDLMAFAGVKPARALAIPKAQQFAEKAHAYSFPWTDRENTRTRDLVDMLLLIERGDLDPEAVRIAIIETFRRRKRHPLPEQLPRPPERWKAEFPAMAEEAGVTTMDVEEAFTVVAAYWQCITSG